MGRVETCLGDSVVGCLLSGSLPAERLREGERGRALTHRLPAAMDTSVLATRQLGSRRQISSALDTLLTPILKPGAD